MNNKKIEFSFNCCEQDYNYEKNPSYLGKLNYQVVKSDIKLGKPDRDMMYYLKSLGKSYISDITNFLRQNIDNIADCLVVTIIEDDEKQQQLKTSLETNLTKLNQEIQKIQTTVRNFVNKLLSNIEHKIKKYDQKLVESIRENRNEEDYSNKNQELINLIEIENEFKNIDDNDIESLIDTINKNKEEVIKLRLKPKQVYKTREKYYKILEEIKNTELEIDQINENKIVNSESYFIDLKEKNKESDGESKETNMIDHITAMKTIVNQRVKNKFVPLKKLILLTINQFQYIIENDFPYCLDKFLPKNKLFYMKIEKTDIEKIDNIPHKKLEFDAIYLMLEDIVLFIKENRMDLYSNEEINEEMENYVNLLQYTFNILGIRILNAMKEGFPKDYINVTEYDFGIQEMKENMKNAKNNLKI